MSQDDIQLLPVLDPSELAKLADGTPEYTKGGQVGHNFYVIQELTKPWSKSKEEQKGSNFWTFAESARAWLSLQKGNPRALVPSRSIVTDATKAYQAAVAAAKPWALVYPAWMPANNQHPWFLVEANDEEKFLKAVKDAIRPFRFF